jgi:hypothetical protein
MAPSDLFSWPLVGMVVYIQAAPYSTSCHVQDATIRYIRQTEAFQNAPPPGRQGERYWTDLLTLTGNLTDNLTGSIRMAAHDQAGVRGCELVCTSRFVFCGANCGMRVLASIVWQPAPLSRAISDSSPRS